MNNEYVLLDDSAPFIFAQGLKLGTIPWANLLTWQGTSMSKHQKDTHEASRLPGGIHPIYIWGASPAAPTQQLKVHRNDGTLMSSATKRALPQISH